MSEEQTMTGKVEGIEGPKEGTDKNKNLYKRYVFTINGTKFSAYNPTFDIPVGGDNVEIKYTTSGIYHNINYLRIMDPNEQVQSENPPVETPGANTKAPEVSPEVSQLAPPEPPQAAPAQITQAPPVTISKPTDTEASIVAQVLIKSVAHMVAHGSIEPGKMKGNLESLVKAYKETKKQLLE